MTVIPALGTVPDKMEKKLDEQETRGRIETIQTTSLLKLARDLRRFAVTETPVKNHQLELK